MHLFLPSKNDLHLAKRIRYLNIVYISCFFMTAVYFLRYNFQYQVRSFNFIFVFYFCFLIALPYWYRRKKNYNSVAQTLIITSSLFVLTLLWTAGGLNSPGIFWISAIPLTSAILLGVEKTYAYITMIALFLIAGLIARATDNQMDLLKYAYDHDKERAFSAFTFTLYSLLNSIYFVKSESQLQTKVAEQSRDINNLLHIMIHDVANPLTNIKLLNAKLRSIEEPTTQRVSNNIERNIKNIELLLRQVRSLCAIREGKTILETKPIHLDPILQTLRDDLQPLMERKELQFKMSIRHEGAMIYADENLLRQVILMNLLTNSIKFSCKSELIELKTYVDENFLWIEVRDYGIGMPDDLKAKVFTTNEPTSRKGTQDEGGTGFGLPLVKEFVQKLKGEIELRSAEADSVDFKRGTEIKLRFPIFKSGAQTPQGNQDRRSA